jgi:hypothetical protein
MKMAFKTAVVVGILFSVVASARGESNDSLEALTNAEAQVQSKLHAFATNSDNCELLLEARKIASSLNPRGDNKATLSALDEGSLRLQLKVLLALARARDPHYDRSAPTNTVYLNLVPPLPDSNGVMWPSGVDPKAIKDPNARKAYEDALAENDRRNEKLKREMALARGEEYALIDIWVFVKRGLPDDSTARKRAVAIFAEMVSDKSILEQFGSGTMPGLTW